MYWLVGLMSLALVGLIATGLALELGPERLARIGRLRRWLKPALATQLLAFVSAHLGLLVLGVGDALAQTTEATAAGNAEISTGMGLAILGAGIPTAFSTIGAGIAVGPIGAASLAAITEKPESLGRTLIYLGLAEGIAIYGLVVSILLLNRI
ncbi:F0F1-type ATP synthase, subunit c/archaeal/vacuolar-type H+-ATPase, subunit K [Thioflavicoccus mobilis 8321]|uniref:ATP synthase F(0) sector subunit c n=1 Tax=Thioflavicoccus mobilis 8321 TaxID=765912 RepID=L0GY92_9GAMM|nr:ATP synthase subunit C [Thioflavicoccus mobilis]AGA90279.1 F0F1-type ATP synthase, subunit c/archaeal/vacuolar-type H+-ATPase, subunit K [Thioflavicoccus mobilis 8321]